MTISVAAAGPEDTSDLVRLFEACGCPCYCRFWHYGETNNAWLDRCANAPERNRAELEAALAARSDEARGIVAREAEHETVVGWLKVAPAAIMTKAFGRKPYRGLPCFARDPAGVFVVGCALVHPERRGRGVASALVAGAVALAPAWGARMLEAFPRKVASRAIDEELWTGPFGAFAKNGFVEVEAIGPYPVMRRTLTPQAP